MQPILSPVLFEKWSRTSTSPSSDPHLTQRRLPVQMSREPESVKSPFSVLRNPSLSQTKLDINNNNNKKRKQKQNSSNNFLLTSGLTTLRLPRRPPRTGRRPDWKSTDTNIPSSHGRTNGIKKGKVCGVNLGPRRRVEMGWDGTDGP